MADDSGRLLQGKIRRQLLLANDPEYVSAMESTRIGTCSRCGACCKMLFVCPYYQDGIGCASHDYRPDVCRAYPIDQQDLDDLEAIGVRCSYSFVGASSSGVASISGYINKERGKLNEDIVDRYTLAHLGVGFASGLAGMPLWSVVVGSLVFEIFENILQPHFTSIFPNTADRDSPMNSAADTLSVMLGWWLATADWKD